MLAVWWPTSKDEEEITIFRFGVRCEADDIFQILQHLEQNFPISI